MKILRAAIGLVLVLTLITGILFPLAITAIAQAAFPYQANGSLVRDGDRIVGSAIIGQDFKGPGYFHPRASAAGSGYDSSNSSGTNLGPISDKLINGIADDPETKDADESYSGVKQLAEAYRKENGVGADVVLPTDAVTRSGSGLDPHISVRNAELQAARVARVRRLPLDQVRKMIGDHTVPAFLGIFGDPAVDVLGLNRALGAPAR